MISTDILDLDIRKWDTSHMPNVVTAKTPAPEHCPTCEGAGRFAGELDHPEAIASRFRPCPDVTCEDCGGNGLRYSDGGCACDIGADSPSDLIAHPEAARLDADGCLVCGVCTVALLAGVLRIFAAPVAAKEAA